MWRFLILLTFTVVSCTYLSAQSLTKAANDAFILTRMVEKFHVQPRPINSEFSSDVYNLFMQKLDDEKLFFTAEDIKLLSAYQYKLQEQIKSKQTDFLQAVLSLYQKRILQADTMIDNICKKPFNFTIAEKLTIAEDTSYPANITAMHLKLYKLMKASVLRSIVGDDEFAELNPIQQKKYVDSIEPILRHRVQNTYKRYIKRMLQRPGGLQQTAGEEYCKAIANSFDPHTEFFPLTEKENFESEIGRKPLAFGFSLDEDDEGNAVISNLLAGSPAFKSGQINKGDKIEAIQWEGKEAIDVREANASELSQTLDISNHDKAVFKIKKADGSVKNVTLWKEQLADDGEDDNKVKSFLLKGSKTIGYLSLPSFYEDWENDKGLNGCANDVAKEIVKLKKEKIDGLIIDVRYNGGGSLQEAVDLAGIFIDAGPVAQYKSREAKAYTLKDANRGTIYDGPLMIMVNGYSASASEIVAGTLQDYNRAVIFGSPTYGKATSQVILPMDTTITLESDFEKKKADSYVKVTLSQLYRITGKTAQKIGVQPDVLVPDALQAEGEREADNKLALLSNGIDANKYYKPNAPLPVTTLSSAAKSKIDTSSYFTRIRKYITDVRSSHEAKDISLRLQDPLQSLHKVDKNDEDKKDKEAPLFTIQTHAFEKQRAEASASVKALDEQWKQLLSIDPYVKLAYQTMLLMPQ
jgi:carboxyl-terminal processing protease